MCMWLIDNVSVFTTEGAYVTSFGEQGINFDHLNARG